ncbi:MAG: hypothetical protein AAB461_00620 [Patescibacteria group bacterium]
MSKILNLRKKPAQALKTSSSFVEQNLEGQRPKEEVRVEKQVSERSEMSWEAPSFYYNPQKRYLYVIEAALLAGAIALLVFKQDILTSVFLILSSLVLFLYGRQKPVLLKITVSQSGISADDIMYYYKDLKSFWTEYSPSGLKELSLESAKWYMPYIKILLNGQNPVEVRSFIIDFLPEKEHEISLIEHIGRRLGL